MLTVADLGILRSVDLAPGGVVVTVTPTYSGCPALREICADLRDRLTSAGFAPVTVATRLDPPWTTDWITDDGRRKLAAAGIAPPRPRLGHPPAGRHPADPEPPAVAPVPALRLTRHPEHRRLQRHRLQVTAPLHRLRRAVRGGEAVVTAPVSQPAPVSDAAARPRRARGAFHRLTVARVEPLTADSAAVTLDVPADLAADFAFAPGQFLTVRHAGERRSYSICAPAGAPPRIGVREVPGGAVSGWLVHQVRPGDVIEVQAPQGTFTPDLSRPGRHVLIGAGSGITPMLSIAASVLAADDASAITLLYGNRRGDTVMFADELADLKDAHPARLAAHPRAVPRAAGGRAVQRPPRRRQPATLLSAAVDVAGAGHWWLCGPYGMVTAATQVLDELGVDPARVHRELFWVGDDPPAECPRRHRPSRDRRRPRPASRSCSTAAPPP